MNRKKNTFFLARVDVQVSLLVAFITLTTTWYSSNKFHSLTYELMLQSLEERVYSLYHILQVDLNKEIFYTINSPYDMEQELYQETHDMLCYLKEATGVSYLYTAKENVHGKLVYVVTGVGDSEATFQHPGASIETEISQGMQLALKGGSVIPDTVFQSERGDIFISYLPIYNEMNKIIGVVGIEFEASEISNTFSSLETLSSVLVLIFTFFSSILSYFIFRRISNPFYMDLASTDPPTHLKNRNAFEVDLNNFITRTNSSAIGLIVVDLNQLKQINNSLGHNWGDDFIKLVADSIRETRTASMIGYRTGGDEFVLIVQDATTEILDTFVYECSGMIENQAIYPDLPCSVSCGWAIFDSQIDNTLFDTLERADQIMYLKKCQFKSNKQKSTS